MTVTLRPMLYGKTPQQQFDIVKPFMLDALKPYKHTTIAELTGEHNIHFHSVIDIEGIIMKDQLLNRFRQYNKYLGRKTCTAVQYEESYDKYVQKDYAATCRIIIDPILKDDYKLFHKVINLCNVASTPIVYDVEKTLNVHSDVSTPTVYNEPDEIVKYTKLIRYLKSCEF